MAITETIHNEVLLSDVHYMPHLTVVCRGKSTTKMCVVYDALSKMANSPLNDCFLKGPRFNQLIFYILV